MWAIFKIFIEFVTILLQFYVSVFWLQSKWDLRFLTRDQTHTLCIERLCLNTRPPGKLHNLILEPFYHPVNFLLSSLP